MGGGCSCMKKARIDEGGRMLTSEESSARHQPQKGVIFPGDSVTGECTRHDSIVAFMQPDQIFQSENMHSKPSQKETSKLEHLANSSNMESSYLENRAETEDARYMLDLKSGEMNNKGGQEIEEEFQIDASPTWNTASEESSSSTREHWTEVRETEFLDCPELQAPRLLLNPSQFTIVKTIGEGGQGITYEALWDNGIGEPPVRCAVKVFKAKLSSPQGQWPDEILQIRDTNLCRLYGFVDKGDDSVGLVMNLYDADLRTVIDQQMAAKSNSQTGSPFSEYESMFLIASISLGMKALHVHGVTHRDLKASNIFCGWQNPWAEESGFWNVVAIGDFENSSDVVGTFFWRSPEVLQALKDKKREKISVIYTPKSDVYSFGMTCYESLTGLKPLDEYPKSNYDMVLSGTRPELPAYLNPKLADFIRKCWLHDPDSRPTSTEIVFELRQMVEEIKTPRDRLFHIQRLFVWEEENNATTPTPEVYLRELQKELHKAHETFLTPEGFALGCNLGLLHDQFIQQFGLKPITDAGDQKERMKLRDLVIDECNKFYNFLTKYTQLDNSKDLQIFQMIEFEIRLFIIVCKS